MSRLPSQFLWGAATAAHQVEGSNVHSDCWALEHAKPSLFLEPSGDAADHYHRYAEDIGIAADLGFNAYRFSVEWARVEPEPGFVSQAALDHYRRVADSCLARGIAPAVTLHHFTQPRWMAARGGLTSSEFPERFAEQAARTVRALDGLALVCTINELNLPAIAAPYFRARASAEQRAAAERALGAPLDAFFLHSPEDAIFGNGLAAHRAARAAIRAERSGLAVGMTLALSEEDAEPGGEAYRDARRETYYAPFLDAAEEDDFVGVQTYSRVTSRADGSVGVAQGGIATTMGWEDRPEAIGAVCEWVASRWAVPMVVTENGYVGEDDERRAAFIASALAGVRRAIDVGADVRGYFYWSLLDNFEWMLGYGQRFGLVAVEGLGKKRRIKPSARIFADLSSNH
ncbi:MULTISPECIES: family 1 glycosylhydrolase [unclassified Sphingopyxis]|uniref:glycoside hydrolase family 1 protein n=1 Tax=unclassified Sphingopyxis TaxID=2614943 RepID=UPI0028560790|nr:MULTISPECIES: family 1 glycosylhydrolase [unclassified Sphingopyxis]MDR6832558.1 beta-glucosidase [Sphingopyxis sp. BE122]MDR7228301.1 beta-glucosidase [Sphingopyxis sp. BE259]